MKALLTTLGVLVGCAQSPKSQPGAVDQPQLSPNIRHVFLGDLMQRTRAYRSAGKSFAGGGRGLHSLVTPAGVVRVAQHGVKGAVNPLELTTAAIERGRAVATDGRPTLQGDGAVRIDRGIAVERLAHLAGGLEQSWSFDRRPDGAGDIVVRVATSGQSFVAERPEGIDFVDPESRAGLRYGVATWIDAAGVRSVVQPRFVSGSIVMTVPSALVERSSFPAVLDPITAPVATDGAGSTEFLPAIAAAADGSAFVVWQDYRNSTIDLYGARLNSDGTVNTNDFNANGIHLTTSAADHIYPSVAFDTLNSSYFVAYTEDDAGSLTLHALRFHAGGGGTIDAPFVVDGTVRTQVIASRVAVNAAGVAAVAYLVVVNPPSDYDVNIARIPSNASAPDFAGSVTNLVGSGVSPGIPPGIASDGTNFLAVWGARNAVINNSVVSYRVLNAGGSIFATDPINLVTPPADSFDFDPTVSFGAGHYHVAWKFLQATGPREMRGQLLNPSGCNVTTGCTTASGVNVIATAVPDGFPTSAYDGRRFLVTLVPSPGPLATFAVDPATDLRIDVEPATKYYALDFIITADSSSDHFGRTWVAYSLGGSNRIVMITASGAAGGSCTSNGDCLKGECAGSVCCATACAPLHAQTTCSTPSGTCTFVKCNDGWLDCDGDPLGTGCETAVSVNNCSGCGKVCDGTNASSTTCSGTGAGTCSYVCKSGWKNCQSLAPDLDGCETDITTVQNCGACNNLCPNGNYCGNGLCKPKQANGTSCTVKDQCQSDICSANGVCCSGACGRCGNCFGGTCNPYGVGYVGNPTCAPYVCDTDTAEAAAGYACPSACTSDAQCDATHYCKNGTCQPGVRNGGSCTINGQCGSGICSANLRCCSNACGGCGNCFSGTCAPYGVGSGGNPTCAPYVCDTDVAEAATGYACPLSCTSDAQCDSSHFCDLNTNACVLKHANGTACTANNQCVVTNTCRDGVCSAPGSASCVPANPCSVFRDTGAGIVTVEIPANSLSGAATLTVTNGGGNFSLCSDNSGVCGTALYQVVITLSNGVTLQGGAATIHFHWLDLDNNGVVDSTSVPEGTLIVVRTSAQLTQECVLGGCFAAPCQSATCFTSSPDHYAVQTTAFSAWTLLLPEASRRTKEGVRALLAALPPSGSRTTDRHVADAALRVEASLSPNLWIDDSHLAKMGTPVFEHERGAVHELMQIASPVPVVTASISALVEVDRALAVTALSEAIAAGADPKHIARSQAEILEASQALAGGHPDKAIDHYRAAWQAATQ